MIASEKVQLVLIGRRPRAFDIQRSIDRPHLPENDTPLQKTPISKAFV